MLAPAPLHVTALSMDTLSTSATAASRAATRAKPLAPQSAHSGALSARERARDNTAFSPRPASQRQITFSWEGLPSTERYRSPRQQELQRRAHDLVLRRNYQRTPEQQQQIVRMEQEMQMPLGAGIGGVIPAPPSREQQMRVAVAVAPLVPPASNHAKPHAMTTLSPGARRFIRNRASSVPRWQQPHQPPQDDPLQIFPVLRSNAQLPELRAA